MDISDIVKLIAKMGDLDRNEQQRLEEIADQIEELDEFPDSFDLDDLDFDAFQIDDDLSSRPGKRSVDDYRVDNDSEDTTEDRTEVHVSSSSRDQNYYGEYWIETNSGGFETFVDLPEDVSELQISLQDSTVEISDPIDTEIPTGQLPRDITTVDAEVTDGGRLLLRVQ